MIASALISKFLPIELKLFKPLNDFNVFRE